MIGGIVRDNRVRAAYPRILASSHAVGWQQLNYYLGVHASCGRGGGKLWLRTKASRVNCSELIPCFKNCKEQGSLVGCTRTNPPFRKLISVFAGNHGEKQMAAVTKLT